MLKIEIFQIYLEIGENSAMNANFMERLGQPDSHGVVGGWSRWISTETAEMSLEFGIDSFSTILLASFHSLFCKHVVGYLISQSTLNHCKFSIKIPVPSTHGTIVFHILYIYGILYML